MDTTKVLKLRKCTVRSKGKVVERQICVPYSPMYVKPKPRKIVKRLQKPARSSPRVVLPRISESVLGQLKDNGHITLLARSNVQEMTNKINELTKENARLIIHVKALQKRVLGSFEPGLTSTTIEPRQQSMETSFNVTPLLQFGGKRPNNFVDSESTVHPNSTKSFSRASSHSISIASNRPSAEARAIDVRTGTEVRALDVRTKPKARAIDVRTKPEVRALDVRIKQEGQASANAIPIGQYQLLGDNGRLFFQCHKMKEYFYGNSLIYLLFFSFNFQLIFGCRSWPNSRSGRECWRLSKQKNRFLTVV